VVREQATALAAFGHRVSILTRRSASEQPATMELAPGVTLSFLEAGPAVALTKGEHERWMGEFAARVSAQEPADLVHSHHWFSGMAALPTARGWGAPHVQSFHSIAAQDGSPLSAGERAESPGRMNGESRLAQDSDAVVAISAAEAALVRERLGGAPASIHVVPPGVDTAMFNPAAPRGLGTEQGSRPYVIVAARLQPLKGLDLAIRAVAAIPESSRPDLLIAGAPSSDFFGYVDELRDLAGQVGLTDEVRFLGPQSRAELARLFRSSRAVLVPSHSETYGLVALEGAASGVPVVAAAAGGLREAVVHGRTGLVLESRDPGIWATAIERILTDQTLADRFSAVAREHAVRLSWRRSAASLLAVYRRLLGSGGAAPSGH